MRPDATGSEYRCEARLEDELRARGYTSVAGLDEVGRGALFGPVVAAAVVLSPASPIEGLNDSKQLSPARRRSLDAIIRERAAAWAVAEVDAATIDRINIYQATRLAMKLAVESLPAVPDYLLVDALTLDLPIPQQSLIKGDARCHAIAAASIVAKVYRDRRLCEWDGTYPGYSLSAHKGYGTARHLEALRRLGPSPLHRMSFAPVRLAAEAAGVASQGTLLELVAGG
jgi:ribonuclease HII